MLETKRLKDITTLRHHNDTAVIHATQAQRLGEARATVLAASRHQEDEAHTQAFTSVAATRSHWVAAIPKALLCYERSWGKYTT